MHELLFPANDWQVHSGAHPLVNHRVGTSGSNIFFVRPEIRRWLLDNVGTGTLYSGLGAIGFDHEGRDGWAWDFDSLNDQIRFKFHNPQHAMLFKLAWSP